MRAGFLPFLAARLLKARQGSGSRVSVWLAIGGAAIGVLALTAVLAVMNGFQLGFIDSILEISSYHLQIKPAPGKPLPPSAVASLSELPQVRAVVPFLESQALVEGVFGNVHGCLLRGLPVDVLSRDRSFAARLQAVEGSLEMKAEGEILIGVELARLLGLRAGDRLSLSLLSGASLERLGAVRRSFRISGLFRSGYYEFDRSWAFISLAQAQELLGGEGVRWGIKLKERFRDREALIQVDRILAGTGAIVASWRSFNRAFFGALAMEKAVMSLLLGLIFVVVGFNIYHTLRRTFRERYEEIGVLKALGASSRRIQAAFLLEGLAIGLAGSVLGTALGLAAAVNINGLFRVAELLTNRILSLANFFLSHFRETASEGFTLFSPAYFYLTEVPVRILLHEQLLIGIAALISAGAAAFGATRRVREVRPVEVLRYQ